MMRSGAIAPALRGDCFGFDLFKLFSIPTWHSMTLSISLLVKDALLRRRLVGRKAYSMREKEMALI